MAELRGFIDRLRDHYGVACPLAHHQPFVSGRQLVYEAQEGSGLAPEFCLVAVVSGQYVLTPASDSYLKRVTWDDDVASAWRPHDDPASPVRVDPEVRFGRPAIHGISTEILWEQSQSGADAHELSEAFDLNVSDVQWALAYEHSHRTAWRQWHARNRSGFTSMRTSSGWRRSSPRCGPTSPIPATRAGPSGSARRPDNPDHAQSGTDQTTEQDSRRTC